MMRRSLGSAAGGLLAVGVLLAACGSSREVAVDLSVEMPSAVQTSEATAASRAALPLAVAYTQQTPMTATATVVAAAADAAAAATTEALPTSSPTPGALTINVWWPDELYPVADTQAEDVLTNQFESFRLTYSAYGLDVRRKRTSGLGGILSTLRSAQPVAPGALPDLTLMRRSDMLTAATEGLIVPLTGWVPTDLIGVNLFPGVLALGEIDGELYGLPYALNIYHTAYRTAVFDAPLATFDDVLATNPTMLFPANRTQNSAVSPTVLLQYQAAGGRLVDVNGSPILDREPLVAVLGYYEQAAKLGIVSASMLQITEAEECWPAFASAEVNMIGVDAWTYLRHKDAVPNTGLAAIPTMEGTPITALEGWMWVLTTHDPDRQNQARAFLSWIMRIGQQSLFTEAIGVLPSQQRALRLWDDSVYAEFTQALILNGEVIPLAQRTGSAAIALQDALTAVLEGTPADEAADGALAALDLPES